MNKMTSDFGIINMILSMASTVHGRIEYEKCSKCPIGKEDVLLLPGKVWKV